MPIGFDRISRGLIGTSKYMRMPGDEFVNYALTHRIDIPRIIKVFLGDTRMKHHLKQ